MNAVTKEESTALTLPQRAAVALKSEKTEAELRELVKSSADIVAVIDPAGREQAHRIAMNLKKARVAIEQTGKAAREDATAFSKAVIAEEKRLVSILTPEEERVFGLRDAYDAQLEAERQAKIAAERARIEAIKKDIAEIHDVAIGVVGKSSQVIEAALSHVENIEATEGRFAEFAPDAQRVLAETVNKLMEMHQKAVEAENAAAEAKRIQLAEEARIAAEREELARLRAEQAERERKAKEEADRIAAQQAAEAKRLADLAAAQEAEAARVRAQAEAEEAERQRVAADVKRQLEDQQARIAADRAALEREQAEAAERAAMAQRVEADHAEALILDAAFDAERAEARTLAVLGEHQRQMECHDGTTQVPSLTAALAKLQPPVESGPTDAEIIELVSEVFDLPRAEAIDRLASINFAAAREALPEAA